jgi:hypothetical protein
MLCGTSQPAERLLDESDVERTRVMLQKPRMRKLGLAFVAAGALSLSAWTSAQARPFGLLLGGGFHPLGGFGSGFRPGGFGGRFDGGAFGLRQAGPGYRGFDSAGADRRWRSGSGRGRYRGSAPLAVGAAGAYSYAYTTTDSDNGDDPAYRHYDRPAYRN